MHLHTKTSIRNYFAQERKILSDTQKNACIAQMIILCKKIVHISPKTIMSYKSIQLKNEINPEPFVNEFKQNIEKSVVCFPKVFPENAMEAFEDYIGQTYAVGKFGVIEPQQGLPIHPIQIDMIFVPLLAFDSNGYRLGYGKGYYDRYVNRCKSEVVKVGLSWFEPIDNIPEKHNLDLKLNYCITPTKLYAF